MPTLRIQKAQSDKRDTKKVGIAHPTGTTINKQRQSLRSSRYQAQPNIIVKLGQIALKACLVVACLYATIHRVLLELARR